MGNINTVILIDKKKNINYIKNEKKKRKRKVQNDCIDLNI